MIAVDLPSIRVGELRRRIDAQLDPGSIRAVVVTDGDPATMARRIARARGSCIDAPLTAFLLVELLRKKGNEEVVVSGLELFSEDEWKRLDLLRSQFLRQAPTILVFSPHTGELLERFAPNLSSCIGSPLYVLTAAVDDVTDDEDDAAQAEFDRLYHEWVKAVGYMSSVTRKVSHPAYQRIIEMGKRAIPPILRDLQQEPKLWGPALQAITGFQPVSKEDEGKVARTAQVWLSWAKDNGYDW